MRLSNRIFRRSLVSQRSAQRTNMLRNKSFQLLRLEDRTVPALISGNIFRDLNNNGILNAGEPGLAGQQVFLDSNNNGKLDFDNMTILGPNNYVSTDVPKAIPDGNPAGVTSSLLVTGTGQVADVNVTLTINHTWVGDLTISLIAPDGTSVVLYTNPADDDGENFTSVTFDDASPNGIIPALPPGGPASNPAFTGSYAPMNPLSALNGHAGDGTWKLMASDSISIDTGSIISWSLDIQYNPGETTASTDANGDYSIPGLADGSYNVRYNTTAGFFVTNTPPNGPVTVPPGQTNNVTITGGVDVTGQNFGRLEANSIQGRVYQDHNGDGVVNSGDEGLGGRLVFRDTNNNGMLDGALVGAGTTGLVPDNTTVEFSANASGFVGNVTNVIVRLNSILMTYDSDLTAVLYSPGKALSVSLFTGVGGSGDNFTNTVLNNAVGAPVIGSAGFNTAPFTGTFSATGALDAQFDGLNGAGLNGDWILELSDGFGGDQAMVVSWTLTIETDNVADANPEPSTITAADGTYIFTNQPAGAYTIRAVEPAGWNRTLPVGALTGSLTAGNAVVGLNFGQARQNAIYGNTYQDNDLSNTLSAGDGSVAGVVLFDDLNSNGKYDTDIWSSFDVPKPVIDVGTQTSTVQVNYAAPITDVNVMINITHTWDSDMEIFLIGPTGAKIDLSSGNGGSGDNYTDTVFDDQAAGSVTAGVAPFTGSFIPEGSLATFNGLDPNGVWTLQVNDTVGGDAGVILSWSIQFNNGTYVEPTAVSDANGNYIFTNVTAGPHTIRSVTPPTYIVNGDPAGGSHAVNMTAGATVQNRNFGFTPDPTPLAAGTAVKVTATGGTSHVVTVVYTDPFNTVIDGNSIGLDDIRVKAPNGAFLLPTAFNATPTGDAKTVSVDYTIPALGGTWDSSDNGVYSIEVVGVVSDKDSPTVHNVATGKVGSFIVGLDAKYVVGLDGSVDDGNTATPADTTVVEALRLGQYGNTTITFSIPNGSATLAGEVFVTSDLTITGPAGGFTLNAAPTSRLFNIDIDGSVVVFSNLTLNGGDAGAGDGGAILAEDENITLNNVTLSNNKASSGSAIAFSGVGGSLTINKSTLTGNEAVNSGTILLYDSQVLVVNSSNIVSNKAGFRAGGIFAFDSTVTLNSSTIADNVATDNGGGLFLFGTPGYLGSSLTVNSSTISGNKASTVSGVGGGGIAFFAQSAKFEINNSTISGNAAIDGTGVYGYGGGILCNYFYGSLVVRNSTIVNNNSGKAGGIAFAAPATSTIEVANSIVAGNKLNSADAATSDFFMLAATSVAGEYNLVGIQDVATNAVFSGVQILGSLGVPEDPMLGALALNGAPVGSPLTHKPLPGSKVIDAGKNAVPGSTDERGGVRTVGMPVGLGDGTDIGAVEIQAAPTVVVLTNGQVGGQHSMVTSFVITFDQPVTITNPSTAFTIFRTFNAGGDNATGNVGYDVAGLDGNNQATSVTITFNDSGAIDPEFGSLRDGKYTVTVNGIGGVTGLDAAMTTNPVTNTWRLFGDGNGDGAVTAADFNDFRLFYGSTGNPLAFPYDFDNNGSISAADFNQFRTRYGLSGYNMP